MNKENEISAEKLLVIRLTKNDQVAFCELYTLYKQRVLHFSLKFLKCRELAEDTCQDVFSTIWEKRHTIDPQLSFSSFLFTITRNRALELLRSTKIEERVLNQILSQAIDYSNNGLRLVLANELRDILEESYTKLTNRQREIFKMSREDLMSHKEIALALNISQHTVNEHITLASKSIKEFLEYSIQDNIVNKR